MPGMQRPSSVGLVRDTAISQMKRGVKAALRRTGYELRPVDASFQELQRDLLATCDLVVDVGANAGQYGQLIRSLGYRGSLLSFEPEERTFAALQRVSADDARWEVRRCALADHSGSAWLNVSANSVSSSLLTIRDEHVAAAPASVVERLDEVPLSTVDDQLTTSANRKTWLKMDVQGAEMAVLRGARETLRSTEVIQAELSLRPLYEDQTDYLELLTSLRGEGFVVVHLLPGFRNRATKHLLQVDVLAVRGGGRRPGSSAAQIGPGVNDAAAGRRLDTVRTTNASSGEASTTQPRRAPVSDDAEARG